MYPVSFDAVYEIERSRLTTFFRYLLAIPWAIWASIYGIGALVVAFIAWFALLFTKRYPEGMYRFISGYVVLIARTTAFLILLTDRYPPFHGRPDPEYPVQIDIAPRQQEYSRAKTFFKYVLSFPQQLIVQGLGFVLYGAAFVTWWRVLFTGKQSATMHDAQRVALAYATRAGAFLLLLTDAHPRMLDLPPQEPPPGAPSLPSPSQLPEGTAQVPQATS
jgi:sugar phosphate permease